MAAVVVEDAVILAQFIDDLSRFHFQTAQKNMKGLAATPTSSSVVKTFSGPLAALAAACGTFYNLTDREWTLFRSEPLHNTLTSIRSEFKRIEAEYARKLDGESRSRPITPERAPPPLRSSNRLGSPRKADPRSTTTPATGNERLPLDATEGSDPYFYAFAAQVSDYVGILDELHGVYRFLHSKKEAVDLENICEAAAALLIRLDAVQHALLVPLVANTRAELTVLATLLAASRAVSSLDLLSSLCLLSDARVTLDRWLMDVGVSGRVGAEVGFAFGSEGAAARVVGVSQQLDSSTVLSPGAYTVSLDSPPRHETSTASARSSGSASSTAHTRSPSEPIAAKESPSVRRQLFSSVSAATATLPESSRPGASPAEPPQTSTTTSTDAAREEFSGTFGMARNRGGSGGSFGAVPGAPRNVRFASNGSEVSVSSETGFGSGHEEWMHLYGLPENHRNRPHDPPYSVSVHVRDSVLTRRDILDIEVVAPKMIQWLTTFFHAVTAKFTLFFHSTLSQQSVRAGGRPMSAELGLRPNIFNIVAGYTAKPHVLAFFLVSDVGASPLATATEIGYRCPTDGDEERDHPFRVGNLVPIFVVPDADMYNAHAVNIGALIAESGESMGKAKTGNAYYDDTQGCTYLLTRVEAKLVAAVVCDGKRLTDRATSEFFSRLESAITNSVRECLGSCTRVVGSLGEVGPAILVVMAAAAGTFVSPEEVKELIDSEANVAIVDVRDDDHEGGHIAGSLWYPSSTFPDDLKKLDDETKDKDSVIFHCMFSQQRGPMCSMIFDRYLSGKDSPDKRDIQILEGGYTVFHRKFGKSSPQLFADA